MKLFNLGKILTRTQSGAPSPVDNGIGTPVLIVKVDPITKAPLGQPQSGFDKGVKQADGSTYEVFL